ncbi:MAG: hypothetical protein HDS41_02605 [Bacteroides sp.]|nr:hypothetical protein [Bacteroides sp.]
MKKLLFSLLAILATVTVASARDKVSRDVSDLPKEAQVTLTRHFPKTGVSHIKIEKHTFGGTEYDVILVNGTEVEFDSDGKWTEIDCGHEAVPSELILKPIRDYVAKNYKGQKIVKISVERSKYEIELSNGRELEFNRAGEFLRIDD